MSRVFSSFFFFFFWKKKRMDVRTISDGRIWIYYLLILTFCATLICRFIKCFKYHVLNLFRNLTQCIKTSETLLSTNFFQLCAKSMEKIFSQKLLVLHILQTPQCWVRRFCQCHIPRWFSLLQAGPWILICCVERVVYDPEVYVGPQQHPNSNCM